MSIRNRFLAGAAASATLVAIALLHILWATGNPFPAMNTEDLAGNVIGSETLPPPILSIAIALALVGGAALIAARFTQLLHAPARRSRLLAAALGLFASALALRGVGGFASSIATLVGKTMPDASPHANYVLWDLALYSPLCVLLATATLIVAAPVRAPDDLVAHALRQARRTSFVLLGTIGRDGDPRSRTVQALQVRPDGTIWIATDRASDKCDEIRRDPRVVVTSALASDLSTTAFSGTAELIDDPVMIERLWLPALKLYFDRGPADERIILIKITPTCVRLIDLSRDVAPAPFGLRGEKIELTKR